MRLLSFARLFCKQMLFPAPSFWYEYNYLDYNKQIPGYMFHGIWQTDFLNVPGQITLLLINQKRQIETILVTQKDEQIKMQKKTLKN